MIYRTLPLIEKRLGRFVATLPPGFPDIEGEGETPTKAIHQLRELNSMRHWYNPTGGLPRIIIGRK